jgi:hypothetical protein
MSNFDLPEPSEVKSTNTQDFGLPEGLEPNSSDTTSNKSKKWIWIVAIVFVLLMCCCCLVVVALLSSESMDFNNLIEEYSTLMPLVTALI